MASSSICSNTKCGKVMDFPREGWRCQGGNVYLCDQCFISFDLGQFCDIYHKNSTYWRSCKFCGKKFHVGCVVSRDSYVYLKREGICCIHCEPSDTVPLPNSKGTMDKSRLVKIHQITDQENVSEPLCIRSTHPHLARNDKGKKPISKRTTDKSTSTPVTIPARSLTDDEETVSERSTPSPSALGYKGKKSYTEARGKAQASNAKLRMGRYGKTKSYRYTPRMKNDEIKEKSKSANVEMTYLFEKILTKSDVAEIGRLILPKKCAEDFLPPLDNPKGKAITIQDTRGNKWRFKFRFWQNHGSRIYVIEGFKPFVEEMNLCQGDKVTFSRLEPRGKLIIGHRKATSTTSPSNKRRKMGRNTTTRSKALLNRKPASAARKGFKAGSSSRVPSSLVDKRNEMKTDTDTEEVPLVTGYLENDTSSSSSSEGGLFQKTTTASPSSRRPIMGRVTKGVVDGDNSKGKATLARPSMFGIGQGNDQISAPSDRKGKAKLVPVSSKRKSSGIEIYSRGKSFENDKKNKRTKKAKTSTLEPEPSRQVETTQVPRTENAVHALTAPQNAKHRRHRTGCACAVCIQPASGRRRGIKVSKTGHQMPPMGQPSNIPNPGDHPGGSQINHQGTVNEDHQNANILSAGSSSKSLRFDLNDLPPESDEDF